MLVGWASAIDDVITAGDEPASLEEPNPQSITNQELLAIFAELGEADECFQGVLELRAQQLPAIDVKLLAAEAPKEQARRLESSGTRHSLGRCFGDLLKQESKRRRDEARAASARPSAPPSDRAYQIELVEKARDLNAIVVLPTGTGKTHVSARVIEHVRRRSPGKLVVYLEKNRNLVPQQKRELDDKYFRHDDGWTDDFVGTFVGGEFVPKFSVLQKTHAIVIITPQMFADRLTRGEVDLKDIALVVLDECHDAKGDHPYNAIMEHYRRALEAHGDSELPQVLGLTATPAWADTPELTLKKLDTLCNNMHGSIVQVTENKESLAEHTREPADEVHVLEERVEDLEFATELPQLMQTLSRVFHTTMRIEPAKAALMKTVASKLDEIIGRCVNPNTGSGVAPNAADDLAAAVKELRSSDDLSPVLDIGRCRVALLLLEHCATAYAFVLTMGWESALAQLGVGVTEAILVLLAADERSERLACSESIRWVLESPICEARFVDGLLEACDSNRSLEPSARVGATAPKLLELKKCLLQHRGGADAAFRGIVFVKKRCDAHRLLSFLLNERELAFVKPAIFIGHSEMSARAQDGVRSQFESGDVNLLIATSVAEEGLNVRACQMVVMVG